MQSPAGRCLAPEAGKVEPCLPPAPSCGSCATPFVPGGPSLHSQGSAIRNFLSSCVREHACWPCAVEEWRKRQALLGEQAIGEEVWLGLTAGNLNLNPADKLGTEPEIPRLGTYGEFRFGIYSRPSPTAMNETCGKSRKVLDQCSFLTHQP